MDQNLRALFDRALTDEPEPPPADLAPRAMAVGLRRRRWRTLAVGGAAMVVVAALGFANVAGSPESDAPPAIVQARFASLLNPACQSPARDRATDVSVFLTFEVTDEQREAVDRALRSDPAGATVVYESNNQAYANFRKQFADAPDLVAAVKPEQMPESFRVTLHGRFLTTEIDSMPGVDQVIGSVCPPGITIGALG